ncbi:hypothetical protein FE257_003690 [Aspergillus nanangensis]|uniref:Uncharacterized protein n=1 Tax=Aspergillus nanangensis TaxID=2582783 RepID=A0AAD4CTU9_ASPNN|nr:hypothetical protein FE257_003690 [Aspergillus nanangensis]
MAPSSSLLTAFTGQRTISAYPTIDDLVTGIDNLTNLNDSLSVGIEAYSGGVVDLLRLVQSVYKVYEAVTTLRQRVELMGDFTQNQNEEENVKAAGHRLCISLNASMFAASHRVYLIKRVPGGNSIVRPVLKQVATAKADLQRALVSRCSPGTEKEFETENEEFQNIYNAILKDLNSHHYHYLDHKYKDLSFDYRKEPRVR